MESRVLPGPGPGGLPGFDARALADYYSYPGEFDGAGTSIALVSLFGGYRRWDLETYFTAAFLPMPVIEDISVDGARNDPDRDPDANVGLTRDLEVLGSVAPGGRLRVYFAPNNEQGIVDGIGSAVFDSGSDASVICLSWEIPENDVDGMLVSSVQSDVQAATMQGLIVCAPSGATTPGEPPFFPGVLPDVLSCGATWAAAAGDQLVERPAQGAADLTSTSAIIPRPDWQADVGRGRRGRRGRGRLIPDVSCFAGGEQGLRCYVNGGWGSVRGSDAAACLWAGLLARIHQGTGRPWSPAFSLYTGLGQAGVLTPPGGPADSAQKEWEPGVGWGTPHGERLLARLRA
jgi:kumamolisin